jgi:taurine transport system permease protein
MSRGGGIRFPSQTDLEAVEDSPAMDAVAHEQVEKQERRRRARSLALRSLMRPNWLSLLTLVGLVVAWYLLTDATRTVDPLYFPSIGDTQNSVTQLGSTLLDDAWATAWRVMLSWSIGCLLGTIVGLSMVRSRVVSSFINPLIEGLRPIPPIALIPFVILWFGLGETGRITLGALACFMILVVTTNVSARNVNPIFVRAARSLGASQNRVYRTVILPAIIPQLVAAVRVAAALSWAVIVAAEYLGAQNGIGFLILEASHTLDTATVLVGTITVGVEAFLFEQLIRFVSVRLTSWVEREGE